MSAPSSLTAPAVGDPTRQEFAQALCDWVAFLSSIFPQTVIPNGSFEKDSDNDGIPDGWTRTLQTNGTFLHDNSTVGSDDKAVHGKRSIKFTSSGGGNGGGDVTMSEFAECTENARLVFTWQQKGTADVKNIVSVIWYDSTQSVLSTSVIYSEAVNNPTIWSIISAEATPSGNARYFKLKMVGCDSSDSTAGSTWFDDVRVITYPRRRTIEVFNSNGTWTCPEDITRIFIEAWGEGGVGNSGGGGAGEHRFGHFTVIPNRNYTVVVGTGGAGAGDNTSFTDSVTGTLFLQANGGTNSTGAAGGAGGTGGSGGDASFNGGTGGGSGAAMGGAACRGGAGGAAATGAGNAGNGVAPGGGGGGTNGGGGTPGIGGIGKVIIYYGLDW